MDSDNPIRRQIAALLLGGLPTDWRHRAYNSESINKVTAQLREIKPDDYASKLALAGFTPQPYQSSQEDISQACETCMYYAVSRKFCDLPELKIPVNPEWSCTLWRI